MDDSLTIKEAAEMLGITPQAVHKRIKAGTLSATAPAGGVRIARESINYALISVPHAGRPKITQDFMLMNGPYEVMEFKYNDQTGNLTPGEVWDEWRAPLGTVTRGGKGSAQGLRTWWKMRAIPESRDGLAARLQALGIEDPAAIPFKSLGLSLSDQYWVRPAGRDIRWEDVNYFDNGFAEEPLGAGESTKVAWVACIGLNSPDNTSEGVLPKRWITRDGVPTLLKGHYRQTIQQPYNEVIATCLHRRILAPGEYVPYILQQLSDDVVCSCPCFIMRDEEYVPASLVLDSGTKHKLEKPFDALLRRGWELGMDERELRQSLSKMIVCDFILANSDRHLRNFGFVRNIHMLQWRFAPLFDSGNCLGFDKSESDILKRDWSYTSRPFDMVPKDQLRLALPLDWLDIAALDGFADEAADILSQNDEFLWAVPSIRDGITARVATVQALA